MAKKGHAARRGPAYEYDEEAVHRQALAAQAGNIEARNDLFMAHRALVERLSRRAKRVAANGARGSWSSSLLEDADIEQQAFVEFCELLEEWQPERTPFLAYLVSLLPWRLLHYVRRVLHYRNNKWLVRIVYPTRGEDDETPEFEDEEAGRHILRISSNDAWRSYIDPLDLELKRTVVLRYFQGLTPSEIAARKGLSRRTIDRQLHSALDSIRKRIELDDMTG